MKIVYFSFFAVLLFMAGCAPVQHSTVPQQKPTVQHQNEDKLSVTDKAAAEERWVVETEVDHMERVHKIAMVRNSLGFSFNLLGTKKSVKGGLSIPFNYPLISDKADYLKIQIDQNPIQRPIFVRRGRVALLYPDEDLIRQIKQGHKLKISYYGATGWTGAIVFSLNGSSRAINEALR